jgi:hypothetical protein
VLAAKTPPARQVMLGSGTLREADMERTDWLEKGYDPAEARFLMVTAITHHRVSSPLWGAEEVRKLQDELAEIQATATQVLVAQRPPEPVTRPFSAGLAGAGFLSTWQELHR